VLAAYQSVNNRANTTASNPFQTYSGQFVAPVNSEQSTGIANTNAAANEAQPYYSAATGTLNTAQGNTTGVNNAAEGLAAASAGPVNAQQIGAGQINEFMSPYLQDVASSEAGLLNQNNQEQQAGQLGTAISSGAFGGDRTGLAAANLEQQQNLSNANIYSNILNTGFNTALGAAQQQQGVNLSAAQANRSALANAGNELASIGSTAYGEGANTASELGALGSGAQTAGLQGANAQLGAGTLQQQTQQAQDTAEYNQFLQQQSYPFQVDQFLANIAEGTGALSGSTTTTQQPGGFFSDRRLKHDIKQIGKTYDGQAIYSYKMHGDKRTHIGLIAQNVEKKHPDAVGLAAGFKTVDYGKATDKAAKRGHFAAGGMPMAGAQRMPMPVTQGGITGLAAGSGYEPTGQPQMGGLVGLANGTGAAGGVRPMGGLAGMGRRFARGGYAEGGDPYGGPYGDISSILASQENMYQPNQTRNRNIPSQSPQAHQLAVASGSPPPPASGASKTQQMIGLGKDAYQGYNHFAGSTPSYDPTAMNAQIANDPTVTGLQNAGISGPTAPVAAPGPESGLGAAQAAAPTADASGLGAADVAAPAAADAAGAAAPAAAAAAAPAAADAAATAGTAAATTAAGAAVDAGATEAASLAAEYAVADAAVAALAAKRGGRIGYDQGGTPYEADTAGDPYSGTGGQYDIPDQANASKLQTAGPLQKHMTGLQTLSYMGQPDNAMSIGSGMFSNTALARGGLAGRRIGKDDGGALSADPSQDPDLSPVVIDPKDTRINSDTLPETTVTGTRPPAVNYTGGLNPVDQAPIDVSTPDKADVAPSMWDKIKGGLHSAGLDKSSNVVPLLTGLAAMGTAPTRSLGVALASGLGAGAQSWLPAQQQAADIRGKQLQNQLTGMSVDSMSDVMRGINQGSTPYSAPAGATSAPPQVSGTGADAQAKLNSYYQSVYGPPTPVTPQESAQLQRAKLLQKINPGLAQSVQAEIDNRRAAETYQHQQGAIQEHDQAYTVATAPNGNFAALQQTDPVAANGIAQKLGFDPSKGVIPPQADEAARNAAIMKVTALHPWTGDQYVDNGGQRINSRTGQVPIGPAAQTLTPQQFQQAYASGIDEANKPVVLGNGLPGRQWQLNGASSADAYARARIPALAAQQPSTGSTGAPAAPARVAPARTAVRPKPAAPAAAPSPAQPDRLPGVDINAIPKLPGPPPVVDKTSQENASKILDINNKVKNDALDAYNDQVKAAARNTALYTQLNGKLAEANPKEFGPTSKYYKAYQGLLTTLQGGNSTDPLTNQAEVDKYLTMLGVGGAKQLVGSENQLRQQELLTLMQHANPNLDQPLAAVRALVAYGKANNDFDFKAGNTAIDAITAGANPRKVSDVVDSRRSDFIAQSLASTPVRTGKVNGKKVTLYADGSIR
jgi:hypothetical protein